MGDLRRIVGSLALYFGFFRSSSGVSMLGWSIFG